MNRQSGNILLFLVIVIASIIFAAFLVIEKNTSKLDFSSQSKNTSKTSEKIPSPDELVYQYSANLIDSTNLGISGKVNTSFVGGSFTLYAKIIGLPDPSSGYSYFGWLGKKDEQGKINYFNVGQAVQNSDNYVNIFQGGTDRTNHIYYVISLESNLEPIAPTDIIAETILTKNQTQPTSKKLKNS